MAKQSVSFLVPADKISRLDALARSKERDRSYVLNEAVDLYLNLHRHHTELIEQGLADFEAGRVMTHEELGRALALKRAQLQPRSAR